MEQFSLEKWLENPSRKITTRYGDREVRIICTDRKDKRPIVALMIDTNDGSEYITSHSINGWIDDEEKYPDKRDLFFADNELTEFEKVVKQVMWTAYNYDDCSNGKDVDDISNVKATSKTLLDLARKELLKELPKWKKVTEHKLFNHYVCVMTNNSFPFIFLEKEVHIGDYYYIDLEDLKNLPKEE